MFQIPTLFSSAVNLFSGKTKEERQKRREERKATRELKKLAKESTRQELQTKLEVLKSGATAKKTFLEQVKELATGKYKNLIIAVAVILGGYIIYKFYLKMKTKAVRRRSIARARKAIKRK